MGYRFTGFIATQMAMLDESRSRWPLCTSEFHQGIGKAVVTCPDPEQSESEEAYESLVELGFEVEDGVLPFSKKYPQAQFVFLRADCAGGQCHYRGWACQNGQVLESAEGFRGEGALTRLLQHIGLKLGSDERFSLFER
jgi:hypothetical protein